MTNTIKRKQQTLETFLLSHVAGENAEVTNQFRLVARVDDGHVRFYIHPFGVNGDTLDFEVQTNRLRPDPSIFVGPDPHCGNCDGDGGILEGGQCSACWVEGLGD